MIRNKRLRRAAALTLIAVGGIVMWLSPKTLGGAALLVLGVVLEAVGIWLERHREG